MKEYNFQDIPNNKPFTKSDNVTSKKRTTNPKCNQIESKVKSINQKPYPINFKISLPTK